METAAGGIVTPLLLLLLFLVVREDDLNNCVGSLSIAFHLLCLLRSDLILVYSHCLLRPI